MLKDAPENDNPQINFIQAKRARNELYLERLYYVSVDPYNAASWINVLGEKAFIAWLQLQTLVDRSEEAGVNKNTVPRSLNSLIKLLGVGRNTFYDKILKVLWNYGFIDLEEYSDSKQRGHAPINILVYPYPQNNINLAYKSLEKVRDYDKDYSSAAKTFNDPTYRNERRTTQLNLQTMYEAKWAHDAILEELKRLRLKETTILAIEYELSYYPTTIIPIHLVEEQLLYMYYKQKAGMAIFDFAKYFVSGLVHKAESLENTQTSHELQKQQNVLQSSIQTREFYNWLVDDE